MDIRQRALEALQDNWGRYVENFRAMSPQRQVDFLQTQGYRRFADLLAHILTWWQDGIGLIERYMADHGFEQPAIEVDAYNAAAVAKFAGVSDADVAAAFESTRLRFVECVSGLTESDLQDKRIVKQLEMELIGHYEEHKLG